MNDDNNILKISAAAIMMANCVSAGGKIISCGNGGSHCNAMHFAKELNSRYRHNRHPLPAIAISDTSYITCAGNDFSCEEVFKHFLETTAKSGDVLLAISTSGQSENILRAVDYAVLNNIKTVVLTGKDGGKLAGKAMVEIRVPHLGLADSIEEANIKIIHTIVFSIDQLLFYGLTAGDLLK